MNKKILPITGPIAKSGTFAGNAGFSGAVRVPGGLLFISGQLAIDKDMNFIGEGRHGRQDPESAKKRQSKARLGGRKGV